MSADWLHPLFVGRALELEWLSAKAKGRGRAIVITGKQGVGKTSLVARYLYGEEKRSWVRWDIQPDPASFAALRSSIAELSSDSGTQVIVIDNAELISEESASNLVADAYQSKRVERVIFVSRRPLLLSYSDILVLHEPAIEDTGIERGKIYDLHHGVLLPERRIVSELKPRIILASHSLAERLRDSPHSVFDLSPRQFEELVAELLHGLGCEVHITPATRDGGKDILAYLPTPLGRVLCLVETKRYRRDRPVGVGLVRQLYGTLSDANASKAMLVTTSSYSKDARAFRQKHEYRLDLRDYSSVVDWIRGHGQRSGWTGLS